MTIQKHQISSWMDHPVTKKMLEIVQEHRDANKNGVCEIILGGPSLGNLDLHVVSQLKGQILAFDEMLNIKTYLIEAIEEDEIYSTGTKSPAEDQESI